MLYSLARPLLFLVDPEKAHNLAMSALIASGKILPPKPVVESNPVEIMGLRFPNRIGLAAGMDKNGEAVDGLARLGFGFIEIGTVTPRAQPGNPKPRLFRLKASRGIINRLGFNNHGLDAMLANIRDRRFTGILGINIGKNLDTPLEKAADDYLTCIERVYPHASYITVNVSSPNTANLRKLQGASELDELLGRLKLRQASLTQEHGRYVPFVLKIAPDLEQEQIMTIADALRRHRLDGAIATNTMLSRDPVAGQAHADEQGGLSGAPIFEKSTAVLASLVRALAGEVPVIAAGGVIDGKGAKAKLEAGAQLVQIYSGLIYRGPELVTECIAATR